MAASPEKKTENKAVKPGKLGGEQIAAFCAQIADDRKASNIVKLKLGELSSVTDYVVVCTGTSEPHLSALAERIQRELRNNYAVRPVHVDGTPESHWMIVDYGSVMVHIMTEDARELYQLESLWGDAPRLEDVQKLASASKKARARKPAVKKSAAKPAKAKAKAKKG